MIAGVGTLGTDTSYCFPRFFMLNSGKYLFRFVPNDVDIQANVVFVSINDFSPPNAKNKHV